MATYEFPNLFSEKHEIEKIWVRRIRGGWMGASGLPRSTNVNVPMFSKSIKFQHEYYVQCQRVFMEQQKEPRSPSWTFTSVITTQLSLLIK